MQERGGGRLRAGGRLVLVPSGALQSASRDARDPEEASASARAEMHLRGASASDHRAAAGSRSALAREQRGAVRPAGVPQIVSVVGGAWLVAVVAAVVPVRDVVEARRAGG